MTTRNLPDTWGELIVYWFQQGKSRERIAKKTGLSLAFIDKCLRKHVKPGGDTMFHDSSDKG